MSTALGSTLDQAADAIAAAPSLALACHHTPDGDALGSMLALHHLALAAGKQSVASWPEPFDVPPHYTFLPGLDLATKPADFPAEPDLMVTFDCGSLGRLAELAPAAQRAHQLIVVDHHSTNDGYGTVNLIDPDAAASAVVVRHLLARLGWDLNREAAQCLYTGLVCDTGRFQYDCTTPAVFELAKELARFDLPIGAMNRPPLRGPPLALPAPGRGRPPAGRVRRRPPLRGQLGHRRRPGRVRRRPRRDRGPDRPPPPHHRG